eukprot:TRINITY_DN9389_c0_g4_i13.p1 TRINITY_DN9389_c0_g4~~TRINITY_DN9389_c0_g4_i13.p1  ORF type:complete len:312 (+),score=49.10 TRINITY_DN9389_c0_g4_i13:63-998(+)
MVTRSPALMLALTLLGGHVAALTITFGSCNHQDLSTCAAPTLNSIAAERSALFVWLGDIIYGDQRVFLHIHRHNSAHAMKQMYDTVASWPAYQRVVNMSGGVTGTWDDHDFGCDAGDCSEHQKMESQGLLLQFLGEPPDSVRWARPAAFGSVKVSGSTALVLLDVRFYRANDTLGEPQWAWLESLLQECSASTVILASGTPVLVSAGSDSWAGDPDARRRLVEMMERHTRLRFVIISGDVHYGEMSFLELSDGRVVYEVLYRCRWPTNQCCWLANQCRWPTNPVSYTHLRAHETPEHLVCRLLLEKKKKKI